MLVGISQNLSKNIHDAEINSVESAWINLFEKINFSVITIPCSKPKNIDKIFKKIDFDLIILSGGNNIFINKKIINASKKRDDCENMIINICLKNNIPVIGICRGMQILNIYFGGSIDKIKNHSNKKHYVKYNSNKISFLPNKVNSYHDFGIKSKNLGKNLIPIGNDFNNNVEIFFHQTKKIIGLMWHPERMSNGHKQILGIFNVLKKSNLIFK